MNEEWENKWIAWVAILISVVSAGFSLWANLIASDSKDFAKEANQISLKILSYNIVDRAYYDIIDSGINEKVMEKLRNGQKVSNRDHLVQYVDIFEGVFIDYCHGFVYRSYIKPKLFNFLSKVCHSSQAVEAIYNYNESKNGVALLCKEFEPNSIFAKQAIEDKVSECHFMKD